MSLVVEIANAVRGRFATEVAAPESLPVVYDNLPDQTQPNGTRWCRLSIRLGLSQHVASGGEGRRRIRTAGVALAQLFSPLGEGETPGNELVGAVQDAFRNVSLPVGAGLTFKPPYISAPPIREDSWWMVPVAIEFYADEDT